MCTKFSNTYCTTSMTTNGVVRQYTDLQTAFWPPNVKLMLPRWYVKINEQKPQKRQSCESSHESLTLFQNGSRRISTDVFCFGGAVANVQYLLDCQVFILEWFSFQADSKTERYHWNPGRWFIPGLYRVELLIPEQRSRLFMFRMEFSTDSVDKSSHNNEGTRIWLMSLVIPMLFVAPGIAWRRHCLAKKLCSTCWTQDDFLHNSG